MQNILSKQQAIEAMQAGKKVTHIYFTDGEFIYMDNGIICDENGYPMQRGDVDFWTDRSSPDWQTNWLIIE